MCTAIADVSQVAARLLPAGRRLNGRDQAALDGGARGILVPLVNTAERSCQRGTLGRYLRWAGVRRK
jgi:2-keto-3-deoxy-L-rhamnonate aldolase RhmA